MSPDGMLRCMRASEVPSAVAGPWSVSKVCGVLAPDGPRAGLLPGLGHYTALLHGAETVMHDHEAELRTHLGFCMQASGRVLVLGLGLGCVVRGLLCNPKVTHLDVVERDAQVLSLVAPYLPRSRVAVTIHLREAREFARTTRREWDCAWSDLWTDTSSGEPHLHVVHAELMADLHPKVGAQGAWAMPRWWRRIVEERGLRWIG